MSHRDVGFPIALANALALEAARIIIFKSKSNAAATGEFFDHMPPVLCQILMAKFIALYL